MSKLSKDQVITEVDSLIQEGRELLKTKCVVNYVDYVNRDKYGAWRLKALNFLLQILNSNNSYLNQFRGLTDSWYSNASQLVKILEDVIEYIQKGIIDIGESEAVDSDGNLNLILYRFHKVARQLRTRHDGRQTINISDEYDVQDLLHALLKIYFDDVRPEEWTPSYAGGASRMDFLLKKEQIVIEVKKTRDSMTAKDLGDQLIIDIGRYKVHQDCKKLYCFVYDPEGLLGNPHGIIRDLENGHEDFVKVIICPMD